MIKFLGFRIMVVREDATSIFGAGKELLVSAKDALVREAAAVRKEATTLRRDIKAADEALRRQIAEMQRRHVAQISRLGDQADKYDVRGENLETKADGITKALESLS